MSARIEAQASEWIAALKAVIPHAATAKDSLPALQAVRVDVDDTGAYLVATDRYTLIMRRLDCEVTQPVTTEDGRELRGPGGAFAVLLSIADVKRILAMCADWTRLSVPLRLELDGKQASFTTPEGLATFRPLDYDYPAYRMLIEDAVAKLDDDDTRASDYAANPHLLAKWAKACDKRESIQFRLTRANKVAVIVGGSFIGLQMCVKRAEFTVPTWAPTRAPQLAAVAS